MQVQVRKATDFPGWENHFYTINQEWLEDYFFVTPADHDQLSNPQRIIENGGSILLLFVDEQVVGTVAIVKEVNGDVEIAKMGILKAWRSKGLGDTLMQAAIQKAQSLLPRCIFLETVEVLKPAIALYEKFGFKRVGVTHTHPKFGRTTFRMELQSGN